MRSCTLWTHTTVVPRHRCRWSAAVCSKENGGTKAPGASESSELQVQLVLGQTGQDCKRLMLAWAGGAPGFSVVATVVRVSDTNDLIPSKDIRSIVHFTCHTTIRPSRIIWKQDSVPDEMLRMTCNFQ